MNKVTPQQIFIFFAVSAAGWLLYKVFDAISVGTNIISETGGALVPQGIIDAIAGPKAQLAEGGAMLPSGNIVTWNAIVAGGSSLNGAMEFTWQNKRYRALSPRRADGLYNAVAA